MNFNGMKNKKNNLYLTVRKCSYFCKAFLRIILSTVQRQPQPKSNQIMMIKILQKTVAKIQLQFIPESLFNFLTRKKLL